MKNKIMFALQCMKLLFEVVKPSKKVMNIDIGCPELRFRRIDLIIHMYKNYVYSSSLKKKHFYLINYRIIWSVT